jgi:plasmid stability protein
VVEKIRESARRHGRSLEAELRLILESAARHRSTEFWRTAERLRKRTTNRQRTDSAELIRAEEGSEAALRLRAPEYDLVCPDLLFLEVGNVVRRKVRAREIEESYAEP